MWDYAASGPYVEISMNEESLGDINDADRQFAYKASAELEPARAARLNP
jgi:hypothetical protein